MYHPDATSTAIQKARSTKRIVIALIVALALCGLLYFGVQSAIREQSAQSMRAAIVDAALQCYAIEGAFPSSITYLEDHYGLVVNNKDYLVTYECYADNVAPSVVVVPR